MDLAVITLPKDHS